MGDLAYRMSVPKERHNAIRSLYLLVTMDILVALLVIQAYRRAAGSIFEDIFFRNISVCFAFIAAKLRAPRDKFLPCWRIDMIRLVSNKQLYTKLSASERT